MNSSSKKPSYAGKDASVSMHKRTYCVAVVEGMLVKKWQTVAVPEQLAKQLQGIFQQPICTVLMKRDFQDLFYTGNLSQLGLNVVVNAGRNQRP